MNLKLTAVIFQTLFFILINLSNISKAQHYPYNGRYPDNGHYANRNDALQDPSHIKDKVSVTVYYETQCPGSIKFLKEQLAPTAARLGSHMDIYMIPYGHAKTTSEYGSYSFQCQHGHIECYGNALHACAIDVAQNNTKAVLFNACALDQTSDYHTLNYLVNSCGYKYDISANSIWENMNNGRGAALLKGYGDETHAARPPYVPYVLIDGAVADAAATNHLGYFVCKMMRPRPSQCDFVL